MELEKRYETNFMVTGYFICLEREPNPHSASKACKVFSFLHNSHAVCRYFYMCIILEEQTSLGKCVHWILITFQYRMIDYTVHQTCENDFTISVETIDAIIKSKSLDYRR